MVVVMEERASEDQIQRVVAQLVQMGFDVHRSTGSLRTVIGAVGGGEKHDARLLEVLDGEAMIRLFERIIDEARRLERVVSKQHEGQTGDS